MTIPLHQPYLLKETMKIEEGGGQKIPKNLTTLFMDDPLLGLFAPICRP